MAKPGEGVTAIAAETSYWLSALMYVVVATARLRNSRHAAIMRCRRTIDRRADRWDSGA
jgi:hypothetical protein